MVRNCAGERPAHVSEQIAGKKALGERAAVHGHEGACSSTALVENARDDLFAGAGLAGQDHRVLVQGDGFDAAADGDERCTVADQFRGAFGEGHGCGRGVHEERVAQAEHVSWIEGAFPEQRLAVQTRPTRAGEIACEGTPCLHPDLQVPDRHARIVERISEHPSPEAEEQPLLRNPPALRRAPALIQSGVARGGTAACDSQRHAFPFRLYRLQLMGAARSRLRTLTPSSRSRAMRTFGECSRTVRATASSLRRSSFPTLTVRAGWYGACVGRA